MRHVHIHDVRQQLQQQSCNLTYQHLISNRSNVTFVSNPSLTKPQSQNIKRKCIPMFNSHKRQCWVTRLWNNKLHIFIGALTHGDEEGELCVKLRSVNADEFLEACEKIKWLVGKPKVFLFATCSGERPTGIERRLNRWQATAGKLESARPSFHGGQCHPTAADQPDQYRPLT